MIMDRKPYTGIGRAYVVNGDVIGKDGAKLGVVTVVIDSMFADLSHNPIKFVLGELLPYEEMAQEHCGDAYHFVKWSMPEIVDDHDFSLTDEVVGSEG